MTAWNPTHAAPSTGMSVWSVSDGAAAPTSQLAAHTPVRIEEQRDAWAFIRCENGFAGWVDARQLVAVAPSTSIPGKGLRPPAVVAVVLGLAAAVVGIMLVSGGAGGKLIALDVPDGWFVSADGMVVAESEADLSAVSPAGPVVRAEVVTSEPPDVEEMLRLVEGPEPADDFRAAAPVEQTISGSKAVSILTREHGRVRVVIAAHPRGRDAVLFTIDAPADRYDQLRSTLAGIPGLAV